MTSKIITAAIMVSLCTLVGCTRVVRTDYSVRPVFDPQGQQIGERVDQRVSSQYVPDF